MQLSVFISILIAFVLGMVFGVAGTAALNAVSAQIRPETGSIGIANCVHDRALELERLIVLDRLFGDGVADNLGQLIVLDRLFPPPPAACHSQ